MGLSTSCGYRTMDGLSRSRGMEEWSMSRGTRQPMGLTCMPFWAPRRVCAGRCLLKGILGAHPQLPLNDRAQPCWASRSGACMTTHMPPVGEAGTLWSAWAPCPFPKASQVHLFPHSWQTLCPGPVLLLTQESGWVMTHPLGPAACMFV